MSQTNPSNETPAEDPPRMHLAQSQEVNLGCGALCLIAIIVMIFSGSDTDELERELRAVRSEIQQLKQSVDAQTTEIRALQRKVENSK